MFVHVRVVEVRVEGGEEVVFLRGREAGWGEEYRLMVSGGMLRKQASRSRRLLMNIMNINPGNIRCTTRPPCHKLRTAYNY